MGSSTSPRGLVPFYEAHGEKIRYLIVGAWNTLFGYGVFLLLLTCIGVPLHSWSSSSAPAVSIVGRHYYLVVQWLGWIIAVPQSTLSMRSFVFKRGGRILPQVGRAFLVYLPAQGLGSLILWVSVSALHLIPQVGALVAILVTTIFSYIGHKYFTFRAPLETGDAPREVVDNGR